MTTISTVIRVASDDEFTLLRQEWHSLVERSRSACLFLTWEWMQTWWFHYRSAFDQLCILTVRDEGRLIGLLPLYIKDTSEFGWIRTRTLRFLGTGECEADEVASEYLDILCDSGKEPAVIDVLRSYIERYRDWDAIVFNDVLSDALIWRLLGEKASFRHLAAESILSGVRYCLELPRSWDVYIATLDSGAGKRLPYKRRKLERSGPITMVLVERSEDLNWAFDELNRLHTARWGSKGLAGVFGSTRFLSFHRTMASILLEQGNLRFRLLLRGDQVVAALYNFYADGTEYFYQAGFDVDVGAKHSLGTVAHLYAIESAIAKGDGRYDFMKGSKISYKSEFACRTLDMYEVHVYSTTLTGLGMASRDWLVRHLRVGRNRVLTAWRNWAGRTLPQMAFRRGRDSHGQ